MTELQQQLTECEDARDSLAHKLQSAQTAAAQAAERLQHQLSECEEARDSLSRQLTEQTQSVQAAEQLQQQVGAESVIISKEMVVFQSEAAHLCAHICAAAGI